MPQKIIPNLWFDTEAEEAAAFYTSVFEDSRIVGTSYYPESTDRAGTVMTCTWELEGTRFTGINGGPEFKFDEAISFEVVCKTQDEIDYYWEKLTDGGRESMCGWLTDRYGLSWQIVPEGMEDVLDAGADPEAAKRGMQAMFGMRKLDIAALRAAAEGTPVS